MFSSSILCSSAAQASSVVASRMAPRQRRLKTSVEPPETLQGLLQKLFSGASQEAAAPPLSRRHARRHNRGCCEPFTLRLKLK
eukprot:5286535-Pyramimonas_sp.AAC.1